LKEFENQQGRGIKEAYQKISAGELQIQYFREVRTERIQVLYGIATAIKPRVLVINVFELLHYTTPRIPAQYLAIPLKTYKANQYTPITLPTRKLKN